MKLSKIPINIFKNIILFSSGFLTYYFLDNSRNKESFNIKILVEKLNEMNKVVKSVSDTIIELKNETNNLKELKIQNDSKELFDLKNSYNKKNNLEAI